MGLSGEARAKANSPLRSVEGPESLTGVDPSLDRPVVLFHDVVQVWTGATATALAHFSLLLQFGDHPSDRMDSHPR